MPWLPTPSNILVIHLVYHWITLARSSRLGRPGYVLASQYKSLPWGCKPAEAGSSLRASWIIREGLRALASI